ncbi:hypothetical protein [Natrialba sp. SSL1]|uniref:hypothetical protein n=1 Tax=Natrialba sp. SSL1 TaxID=1869245 RepID=UPI0008F84454|nr:hypothetical protein [Natrialba sp. SSL1]OIB55857.1 hypothetical protein BBD46_20310 [Natrialba sp. SSL1]
MNSITAPVAFTPVPASLPSDLGTILAVLFMLIGVPMILFGLIFLYTGYVRYDAEQYLDELEELENGEVVEGEGAHNGTQTAQSADPNRSTETETDHEADRE